MGAKQSKKLSGICEKKQLFLDAYINKMEIIKKGLHMSINSSERKASFQNESTSVASEEDGNDDENLLLEIFPTEVWLAIFKNLDPMILEFVYHSSPFFASVLWSTRAQFMFPSVLKCLIPHLLEHGGIIYVLQESRLVCRSWKKAIDTFLQDQSHHANIEVEGPAFPLYLDYFHKIFEDTDELNAFNNHFQPSHFLEKRTNPFVSRHLGISYYSPRTGRNSAEYLAKLREILKKCGEHVWYCDLNILIAYPDRYLTKCKRILELLPNLKVLNIVVVQLRNFANYRVLHLETFPVFPKLQCFKIIGADNAHVFDAVVSSNPHVKMLSRSDPNFASDPSFSVNPMCNLEELRTDFRSIHDFQQLDVADVNWPLKKLFLSFNSNNEDPVPWEEMGRCFQILERKFGNTLQLLQLDFPRVCTIKKGDTLYLPKLTSLTMNLPLCIPLDWILSLDNGNLRMLHVNVNDTAEAAATCFEEEVIPFFTTQMDIFCSNIWDIFPNLEEVTYWHKHWYDQPSKYKRSELKIHRLLHRESKLG